MLPVTPNRLVNDPSALSPHRTARAGPHQRTCDDVPARRRAPPDLDRKRPVPQGRAPVGDGAIAMNTKSYAFGWVSAGALRMSLYTVDAGYCSACSRRFLRNRETGDYHVLSW